MPRAPTGRPRTTYVTNMVTELSMMNYPRRRISNPAPLLERHRQLLINAIEAAVGKNRHHITRLQPGCKPLHDGVRCGIEGGVVAGALERSYHFLRMHSLPLRNALLLEDSGHENTIGQGEALHQLTLKDISAQGIGAWLKDCPQSLARVRGAQGFQRLAY